MIQKIFSLVVLILGIASSVAADSDIVSKLEGTIFFLKRDGEILNLYMSDAKLSKIRMIYSHKGKGGQNGNIIGFYYDVKKDVVYFQAIKDGKWSLYSIGIGSNEPVLINQLLLSKDLIYVKEFIRKEHYIKPVAGEMKVVNKNGSLYLLNKEKEVLLKKYHGSYDGQFAIGYEPIGFSPDNKYLIYSWSGHRTGFGTFLAGFIKQLFGSYNMGNLYIMELETMKTNKYLPFRTDKIQWVMDRNKEGVPSTSEK